MRVVWVTRSFLDYRVPVYGELNRLIDGNLKLVYNRDYVPERVQRKVMLVLGDRAVGLTHELCLLGTVSKNEGLANSRTHVPFQPGLTREIRRHSPDVVVSDGFLKWTYGALWLRAVYRVPHVMCYERTAHTERHAQWYRTAYRRSVMRWIDAMCCNGRLCGEYVRSLGYPGDRITYGHMAADVEGLRRGVEAVRPEDVSDVVARHTLTGTVFLYVGRLIPGKGVRELLLAWHQFETTIGVDRATLLLVGDGPQRSELEEYCHQAGLKGVRFAGHVDYDNLAPYYKAADVFVIPTLEDNWSLVVPEAMACGLPILCSKYNGCWPELVTPENGWVFDPLSPPDCLNVLRESLYQRDILPEMGRASMELVARHTPRKAAESILAACRMAIANAGRRW